MVAVVERLGSLGTCVARSKQLRVGKGCTAIIQVRRQAKTETEAQCRNPCVAWDLNPAEPETVAPRLNIVQTCTAVREGENRVVAGSNPVVASNSMAA